MFRVVFLSVVLLVHAYLASRLVLPLDVVPAAKALLFVPFGVAALAYPLALRLRSRGRARSRLAEGALLFVYGQMGFTGLLLSLVVIRDLLWLLAWLVDVALRASGAAGLLPDEPEARRALFVTTNVAVLGLSALGGVVGVIEARRTPRVKRVRVPVDGLPVALDGFTIAHLTDLHVGPTIKRDFVAPVVARVNELAPDAIALTGDFVDGSVDELRDHVAPLAELRARHGAFYVTGNHEYYAGAEPWLRHFSSLGLRTLVNAHEVLEHDGERLVIAGVCDYGAGSFVPHHKSDPALALRGAPDAPRVLLAHQPRSAPAVKEAGGVDLMLTGHTHGGQMWPWNLFVPLQQPLVAGLHRLHDMWVYVSRGTGYWGPPYRVGAPSEIALLTLTRR